MFGQFQYFKFDFVAFIVALCVRCIGEDEGGAAAVEDAPADEAAFLDTMFGEESQTPADASAEESEPSDAASQKTNQDEEGGEGDDGSSKEQAVEISDEELESALSPEESPEKKTERLERDYKASSKEARRLKANEKAINELVKEQGLKLSIKDGKAHLVMTDKYKADESVTVDISKMSDTVKDAFESGDIELIQPELDKIVNGLVRPLPTLDKEPEVISPERLDSVFETMTSAKNVNDEPENPGLEANRKHIENLMDNPAMGEGWKVAMSQNPEQMVKIMNVYVNHLKAQLSAKKAAKKAENDNKKSEAKESSSASVDGGSTPKEAKSGKDGFLGTIGNSRFG